MMQTKTHQPIKNRRPISSCRFLLFFFLSGWTTTTTTTTNFVVDAASSPSPHFAAFAAAKKKSSSGGKGKGKKGGDTSRTSNKGFGAPPPSLDGVLAQFPTRLPPLDSLDTFPCPCRQADDSNENEKVLYADCCGPLHEQTRACTTMADVLRSRYSAFCLRKIQHIMDTTHPSCRDYQDDRIAWAKDLNKEGMFDSFEFIQLKLLTGGQEEEVGATNTEDGTTEEGFLEFQVILRGREQDDFLLAGGGRRSAAAVSGLETVVKERSKFLRDPETGVWSYASGDVTSDIAGLEDTKLNV
jgi:SEC-C motif-containing protein